MPHILVAGKIHEAGLDLLRQSPGVTFDAVEAVSLASYLPFLPRADAVVIRTQPMPASAIAEAPRLKIVSRHGVGFDSVDVPALTARHIPLAVVGDVNSRTVAEHTLMLMLAAARRTVFHDAAERSGRWELRNTFDSVELEGKRLLLIGFGRIGRRVADIARAFGMDISAFDTMIPAAEIAAGGAEPVGDLAAGLAAADIVSLHMPGSGNRPVLGAAELARLKPTAIVVNTARGGLIDEVALDSALRARRLGGAGIDVLMDEPPKPDHPLLSNPYAVLTPHTAGLTQECAIRMAQVSVRNVLDYFAGRLDRRLVVNAAALGL